MGHRFEPCRGHLNQQEKALIYKAFLLVRLKKARICTAPQKLDFFCLTFGVQYIFNSLIYFLISHNYFTCPGSSNSFFSITYATFASLLIKEHISIMLQKLSDRKIPFICNLLPTFYFTFLTEKIIIRSIYFRRFLCHFYQKIGQDC